MAGPALQIDHDNVFGSAPTRAACEGTGFGSAGLQPEQAAERKAEHAGAADTKQIAPGHFQIRITEIRASAAGDFDHRVILVIDSVIEKESGAVDEGPGEVLDDDKALVFELVSAGNSIFAELNQTRVEEDRFLCLRESFLQFGQFGVGRQGLGGLSDRLAPFPEFNIGGAIVIEDS